MYCESADLILQINGGQLVAFEFCGFFFEFIAHHFQIIFRTRNGVGGNGDVALCAKARRVHTLYGCSGKYGAVSGLLCEAEEAVEGRGCLVCLLLVLTVDADMG